MPGGSPPSAVNSGNGILTTSYSIITGPLTEKPQGASGSSIPRVVCGRQEELKPDSHSLSDFLFEVRSFELYPARQPPLIRWQRTLSHKILGKASASDLF